jgi:hypothetical protein
VLHKQAIHAKNQQEHTIYSFLTSNHPSNKTYQKPNVHMHYKSRQSQDHYHIIALYIYLKPSNLVFMVFRRTYLRESASSATMFFLPCLYLIT